MYMFLVRNVSKSSVAILLSCLLISTTCSADNVSWPQWRGPHYDLRSAETDWSADNPTILWKANVGIGYSSVTISGTRLLTMGYSDEEEAEVVYCLDTRTGQKLWTQSYQGALVDNLHRGGPGSTPTIHGRVVYTLGREGQLNCLKLSSGKVIWSAQLQERLGVELPEWGFTCSPIVRGGRVILDVGRVVALDKRNGEVQWQTGISPAGYGSPTPLKVKGLPCIAVLHNEGLSVVRERDGSEIEFSSWETSFLTNSTSPVLVDDKIFLSTGYERGCALLEWKDDRLETVYENRNMSNHMNNSVLWQGHLFGFDGNAHRGKNARLVCLDAATGEEAWSELGLGCGSLMLADGKLLILSEDGQLVIAAANPQEYTEISRIEAVPERCWTVPVLAGGQIYCRNDVGNLTCVSVVTD